MDQIEAISSEDLRNLSPEKLKELREKLESFVASHKGEATVKARANKNRPREVSAKRPEPKQLKKIVRRDPRFDDRCGSLNLDEFQESYKFLEEVHEQEKKVLAREIKRTKDEESREQLKKLQQRIQNQDNAKKEKEYEEKIKKSLVEEQLEKTGNRFINKSKLKQAKLVEKFKDLQKSGKLDKYLERKRKKNASKERHRVF